MPSGAAAEHFPRRKAGTELSKSLNVLGGYKDVGRHRERLL